MFGQFDYNALEQRVLADEYGKQVPFYVLVPTRFVESMQEIIHHYSIGTTTVTKMNNVLSLFECVGAEMSPDITPALSRMGIPCVTLYAHDLSDWKPKQTQWGYTILCVSDDGCQSRVNYLTPKYNVGKQLFKHNKHLDWAALTKAALRYRTLKLIKGKANG